MTIEDVDASADLSKDEDSSPQSGHNEHIRGCLLYLKFVFSFSIEVQSNYMKTMLKVLTVVSS